MQQAPSAGWAGRWFPALTEAAVGRYLIGQLVSVNGTWVIDITINLLVWRLTASPALLGAVNFLLFGPMVVVAPLAGLRLRSDNARRATLSILAVSLAIALALAALAATHALGTAAIAVLALLRGICSGLELPARQVLLAASVVNPALIGNAVAMNTVVFNVGRMLGPAIAAALFAALDATWGFAIGAATLVVMILCVASMPLPPIGTSSGAGAARGPGLRHAVRYVRADRIASLFMPTCALVGLFAGSLQTIVPALADRFGGAAAWAGWLFGASGFGSLCAGILLSTSLMPVALSRLQISMPWVVAAALIGVGFAPLPVVAMLWFFAMGFAFTFCAAGFNSGLQQRAPAELRGPLIGLYSMCFMGSLPLGHLLAGILAQRLGVRVTLLILGALMAAGAAAVFVPRWVSLRRVELNSERI
ncbi:MFS transporter [Piscinibacter koreensis]|uniref:MFS transporter n=1 Tax=Piscinibacter koreensis TaxID=2742824 RepID=A0A7Y6TWJ0_9BURK|nr:MFS transporter [Schlegelella koreensis]NUZ06108.1 MFS transporter [Schlegelella koreensis]